MTTAYLSLGTNLGDRLGYLTESARLLSASHTRVTRVSSVYETAPQGKTDQPSFLNLVVEVETSLDARGLLGHVQAVERQLGRERKVRWGPRTIDVDIVLFDDQTHVEPDLTLPHPRMHERAFVLVPLLEVNPNLPFHQTLRLLPDQGVHLFLAANSFAKGVIGVQ